MENINQIMDDFNCQLQKGNLQKAYRYIFTVFSDLGTCLKKQNGGAISINALYHGYLDMTYLPVVTNLLKQNGLKIALVFNYSSFQFEIWLSAVNRTKRNELLNLISHSTWNTYKTVENNENTDAIIEYKLPKITNYENFSEVVNTLSNETITFINNIENFIQKKHELI